jgi:tRNA-splicing ligase RtcB
MPIETLHGKGQRADIQLWTPLHEVESGALDQLKNIAALPWVFHHVAVMPDVHLGKGATVGSVVAMKDAVCPAAVGVDIGCGMGAVRTSLRAADLPDSLARLRSDIEAAIPVGFNRHERPPLDAGMPGDIERDGDRLFSEFAELHPAVQDDLGKAQRQVGTLGGGNHFIELCLDEEERVWLMLHSGSRNVGKVLAEVHIGMARKLTHNHDLPDRDLAAFLAGTPEMAAYRHDLLWAQRYAMLNRRVMFELYERVLRRHFPEATLDPPILCHHNYVSEETHFGEDVIVTRKGAISARAGEMGIIPGSMGTSSYIVRGLGNPDSFTSASHGAGRRMSRGQAKRTFTTRDLRAQTEGIECRKDAGVVDEIPGAYKDIDKVMANQADLVEVVARLRQVLVVKG